MRLLRVARDLALAAALVGCGHPLPPDAPQPAARGPLASCHYEVEALPGHAATLDITASCDGKVDAFVANEAVMAHLIDARDETGQPLERRADRFFVPPKSSLVRYRIDLDDVAREVDDVDVAYRVGRSWLAPASTWLLRPEPARESVPITVRVTTPPGVGFVTGLRRDGEVYRLESHEIRMSTFAVFGTFQLERIGLPGPMSLESPSPEITLSAAAPEHAQSTASIDLVLLDGDLDTPTEQITDWVRASAEAVTRFWNGFPVERVMLVVIPVPGRFSVQHGKVVAMGGASIVLSLGEHASSERMRDDWILVHELFHLGVPTFMGEGKWLDEGLATYYEPIIRSRAGFRSNLATWREFSSDMPQGLGAVEDDGLEQTKSYRGVYWGGAIVALLADVATRERTQGQLGLEDGLRAVLAEGGNATQIWSLEHVIEVVDQRLGAKTLQSLAAAHAQQGNPVGLQDLFARLGIEEQPGGLSLSPDAPLASVREAIITPPRP